MKVNTKMHFIPSELINRSQWALSNNKVPYQINGERASSTEESTWASYDNVINKSDYVGYFISEHDPYTVIDLDDCIVDGVITNEATSIVESLNSFTEVSKSGRGLHIFVKANKPGTRSKNLKKGFEMYDKDRFIVMTGNHLEGTPIEIKESQEIINYLQDTYFPKKLEIKNEQNVQESPPMSDDEILNKIRNAKNKDKFISLFEKGDIYTWHNGDRSSADIALCNMLAPYTQDAKQIERIIRQSALNRDKWDEHSQYLLGENYTIQKAIEDRGFTYKKKDFKLNVNQSKEPKFILTKKGAIKKLLRNLKEMLKYDPKLNELGFNEFTQEVTIKKESITENFIAKIRYRIDSFYQITFTKDDIVDMLGLLARERNTYHPIKKMIESRLWDGQYRVETMFIDYLGASDNNYTRSITKKWLAGAIARIYEPGIKMEIVPVLQGSQGKGKSTLAAKLGKEFFVDSLQSLGNTKDDYQQLIGASIVELSELSSMSSTKVEKTKSFISAQSDKIRLPYDRVTQDYKRTCVFIGTTNNEQFLNDLTGNRRFFPIPLKDKPKFNVFELEDDVIQQIWAEAYQLYKNGEKLFLNENDEKVAELYRRESMEEDLFYKEIEDYLNMKVPNDWNNLSPLKKKEHYESYMHQQTISGTSNIDRTTAKEIAYILEVDSKDRTARSQMKKINLFMDNLEKWKKSTVRINGKPVQGYRKE